ncbi:MAG: acyl-ACP--UDP-N-acetylglucosamine O-acyltransferase [Candidatus Marinimicrobia bacterium]|nr:acyl-ACP--UDP-N-acetylglucosamine O-acyltransferase [Candidatus Neomarinimicrobiota bacterium]
MSQSNIHPTAIIDPLSNIAENVRVGPYSIIADNVTIGSGSKIGNFVTIDSGTEIGSNCSILHNSAIGVPPQDLKYNNEDTKLVIGNNVVIRESCTLNRGTAAHGVTEVGDNCLLMAYVHIAHDCTVGENAIFANQATLGGHVEIGEWASLGGGVLVHQFCHIGAHAFIGGGFRVVQDVPPFILAAGEPLRYAGINRVGLERRGFDADTRTNIKKAYRILFRSKLTRKVAMKKIESDFDHRPEINQIINFIESSTRNLI